MNRRQFCSLAGGGVLSTAAGIGAFSPSTIIGMPRAEGDAVSIARAITDDSITYRPEDDTVRYATVVGADGAADYETEPFERWARRRCASVGSEAVLPALRDRFEHDLEGIGKGVESEYIGLVITVSAITTRNRDGEIVSEPNVAFDRLVAETPGTVHATISVDGREYTRDVPVFVDETEVSYL